MPQTNSTNPELQKLIFELGKRKEHFYRSVAKYLSKPARKKRSVNLWKINKVAQSNESIVVPGTVLSKGDVEKPVKVYAWRFSQKSKDKITKAGGSALTLRELLDSNEQGRIVI